MTQSIINLSICLGKSVLERTGPGRICWDYDTKQQKGTNNNVAPLSVNLLPCADYVTGIPLDHQTLNPRSMHTAPWARAMHVQALDYDRRLRP